MATKKSVLKSAAAMSLATLCSRVLGMVRDMVMAALFPRIISDAFVVAFRLPNLFRRILGEGSLSASFVPLYVESLQDDSLAAQKFSSAVFTMLTALTATLSALGIVFMPWVMNHLVGGEGYLEVDGKLELTIWLARLMFGYLFLVTTYAFLMSVANAHKIFFIPALTPAAFNLCAIIFAFLPEIRIYGDQMAVGVLVGGTVQMAIAGWPLFKLGVIPRISTQWSAPRVARFFRIVVPSMLGMSVAQLLGILNVNFASRLPEGTHTYIYFADRLLELPQSLLSVSLGVALLPTLSELWARGQKEEFLDVVNRHVRLLMVLSLPAAVGLFVLAKPLITVIFGRGEFAATDIESTSLVLSIYSIVLIVSGLHRVTVPAFYAAKNTWLPAANSAFCLVIHFFVASWATDTYGLQGLVGATAFTGTLNLCILLVSFRFLLGRLGFVQFTRSVLWLLPAILTMSVTAYYCQMRLVAKTGDLVALIVSIALAMLVFFISIKVTRHPEGSELINLIRRKIKK